MDRRAFLTGLLSSAAVIPVAGIKPAVTVIDLLEDIRRERLTSMYDNLITTDAAIYGQSFIRWEVGAAYRNIPLWEVLINGTDERSSCGAT